MGLNPIVMISAQLPTSLDFFYLVFPSLETGYWPPNLLPIYRSTIIVYLLPLCIFLDSWEHYDSTTSVWPTMCSYKD